MHVMYMATVQLCLFTKNQDYIQYIVQLYPLKKRILLSEKGSYLKKYYEIILLFSFL